MDQRHHRQATGGAEELSPGTQTRSCPATSEGYGDRRRQVHMLVRAFWWWCAMWPPGSMA